jgi:hypothetical protein
VCAAARARPPRRARRRARAAAARRRRAAPAAAGERGWFRKWPPRAGLWGSGQQGSREKMSVRAAILYLVATSRGPLSLVAGSSLPRWPDSSVGVHEFLTMDIAYKGKAAEIKEAASRFDFIWGSSLGPAWRNVSTEIVTSLYTPYAWGSNITWWQINHPDWLLYKCDRVTPAYWDGIKADVPFDMSNEDAVRFRYHQIGGPGYNAIAADMFYLENTAGACGAWRAPTSVRPGESTAPQWVQLFSGKSSGDPKWEDAQIRWAQQCRALLHAHDPPLLLIPNYSLLGRSWDDPLLQRLLGSVDGILDEQGYSNYGGMDSGKSYFANLLKHQTNAQKKGCAYYQINEVHNTNSNATRRFVVGAYLQGRDNASAVFMSDMQDYGEEVPHRAEFDAPVGRALGPTIETNGTAGAAPNSGCWVREFSHAVVAVNANKLNTSACSLLLDPRRFSYQDVYGRPVEGAEVAVAENDAAILLRENRIPRVKTDEHAMDQPQQPTTANKTVMAWIADIGSDIEYREVVAWVSENRNAFNAVSDTTLYKIATNGTLSKNLPNLHRHAVWKQQHGGIRTSPCIYGDTTLATMRLIWQNPEPFIQALLADAQQFEFDGIVIDWEAFGNLTDPAYPPLANDGVQYAKFLRRFSEAAQDVGVFISVTADTPADECTPQTGRNHGLPCPWYVRLWNWELLAESGCRLAVMSTYTENDGAFGDYVKWTSWFGSGQNIGIGVCPACLHDAHFNTSKAFLDYRFDLINQNQFSEIDVWVLGYRDWKGALAPWLQHLSAFISG